MLTTYQKQAKLKLITTVVALVVIAGVVVITDSMKPKTSAAATTLVTATNPSSQSTTSNPSSATTTTTPPSNSSPTSSSSSTSSSSTSGYKDGTYTATSDYYVPHGSESIQVSLTLSNGVVTSASVQNSENDNQSAMYQENFAAAYKSYVVGKKISGLQLSVVGGASDTTQGFNDALSQIASKAQA